MRPVALFPFNDGSPLFRLRYLAESGSVVRDMIAAGGGVDTQGDPDGSGLAGVATPEAAPSVELATPAPKRQRRKLPIALAAGGVLVVLLGACAIVANALLSQTYSAQRAVHDYFAAQARRDVDGMLANATFLRGEGSYSDFFGKTALEAMMTLPANSDLHDVKLTSVRDVDSSTKAVTVSMTWNRVARTETLTVRQDTSRVHWLLYPSWRVEIPSILINVKLPNQPGVVSLDGIPAPAANQTAIQSIRGFHKVTMLSTAFWREASQDVDAVDSSPTATITGTITQSAIDQASAVVRDTFSTCDPSKYDGCFNHTYSAPNNKFIWYFTLPGYGDVAYTKYIDALTNDPTVGMKLTVEAEAAKVSVSGTCTETMTVDGSRHYQLKGDFSGTLTWTGSGFGSDLTWNCERAKG